MLDIQPSSTIERKKKFIMNYDTFSNNSDHQMEIEMEMEKRQACNLSSIHEFVTTQQVLVRLCAYTQV